MPADSVPDAMVADRRSLMEEVENLRVVAVTEGIHAALRKEYRFFNDKFKEGKTPQIIIQVFNDGMIAIEDIEPDHVSVIPVDMLQHMTEIFKFHSKPRFEVKPYNVSVPC